MWSDNDARALELAELASAERRTEALRRPESRLDHLPRRGFTVQTPVAPEVRNAARTARRCERIATGRCYHCGRPTDHEGAACRRCRDAAAARARRLLRERRRLGFCQCGAPADPGFTTCKDCRRRKAERKARLRDSGFCSCGAEASPGFRTCAACREGKAAWGRRVAAAGRCSRCPAEARPGRRTCADCAERAKERRARLQAAGLCWCTAPATPGLLTCADCRKCEADRRRRIAAAGREERPGRGPEEKVPGDGLLRPLR